MQKFPNDPIFTKLALVNQSVPGVVIHDDYGIDAASKDLVNDIKHLRETLRKELPSDWFDVKGLLRPDVDSIATISLSGYYFLVGFFAIAALGGKCVPLPTGALPEEALYFLNTTNTSYLLTEPNTVEQAAAIKGYAVNKAGQELHTIHTERVNAGSSPSSQVEIDEDTIFDAKRPCLIIFTSGTTGRPKGVVIPRKAFFFRMQADPSDLFLAYRPVHWMGGASGLLVRLLTGSRVYLLKRRPEPADFWAILKEGKVTGTSLPPALFKELEDYYMTNIRHLPSHEHDKYVTGAAKLRVATNSGSTLNPSTAQFWKKLTNMKIRNVYASTEIGGAALMAPIDSEYIDRCIGRPIRGVEVKLSDGDEGEILVKASTMFTHYINNETATKDAFDEEGFFKTGDVAQRIGDLYFFKGRAKSDWIRFWHFKIPVLELEEHLMQLPYIVEAHVLPVLDHEAQGLAAALVRLQGPPESHPDINLRRIREDLSANIELYKLPALLYILKDGEEVPKTASEKVIKPRALEKYFHLSDYRPRDYAVEEVEFWGNQIKFSSKRKAWDWEGEE